MPPEKHYVAIIGITESKARDIADAALIAHAPEDLAYLLGRVEELSQQCTDFAARRSEDLAAIMNLRHQLDELDPMNVRLLLRAGKAAIGAMQVALQALADKFQQDWIAWAVADTTVIAAAKARRKRRAGSGRGAGAG